MRAHLLTCKASRSQDDVQVVRGGKERVPEAANYGDLFRVQPRADGSASRRVRNQLSCRFLKSLKEAAASTAGSRSTSGGITRRRAAGRTATMAPAGRPSAGRAPRMSPQAWRPGVRQVKNFGGSKSRSRSLCVFLRLKEAAVQQLVHGAGLWPVLPSILAQHPR